MQVIVGVVPQFGVLADGKSEPLTLLALLAKMWLFGLGCGFLDTGGAEAMLTLGWGGNDPHSRITKC